MCHPPFPTLSNGLLLLPAAPSDSVITPPAQTANNLRVTVDNNLLCQADITAAQFPLSTSLKEILRFYSPILPLYFSHYQNLFTLQQKG